MVSVFGVVKRVCAHRGYEEPKSHLANALDIFKYYMRCGETWNRGRQQSIVCYVRGENSKIVSTKIDSNNVGASGIKDGRVILYHCH